MVLNLEEWISSITIPRLWKEIFPWLLVFTIQGSGNIISSLFIISSVFSLEALLHYSKSYQRSTSPLLTLLSTEFQKHIWYLVRKHIFQKVIFIFKISSFQLARTE